MTNFDSIRPVKWQDDAIYLLDQRVLPAEYKFNRYDTVVDVALAIKDMVVRGAPAIGITAAYAVIFAARECQQYSDDRWLIELRKKIQLLAESRPTAVNLQWALSQMTEDLKENREDLIPYLLGKANEILNDDINANKSMGSLGAALIENTCGVLTHCNAGALATGGYGTALGVIRSAFASGKISEVYADETRPWLQGSRLTAWELAHDGIPVILQADNVAGHLMQQGKVSWVIVGSDRIASNGDVANKIGTYNLAILAKYHGVKFMVVAPTSTVDMQIESGESIPIEQRPIEEVIRIGGVQIASDGANAWNPAFDVTPAELVDVIVTEKGCVHNPDYTKIKQMMDS